ncbi:PDR/VanB family oxidoreductase [uncultured Sulfitobacter sp.]|uniref:PDR/VanB family oxidoreductase n=1 Tax=uncultured Sulfitobacter sp. TaxID=191468 RepID=UPI00262DAF65|nr:PDR/VanB family oxidoreductase [uncultured Sulfitobacter sp.]
MGKIDAVVDNVQPLTDRISAFRLRAAAGGPLPDWEAGAHIDVEIAEGTRSYSLISFTPVSASPDSYTIAVQREDDGTGGSAAMHELQAGDALTISQPKNDFQVTPDTDALLLAGGIGVTPLISMAAAVKDAGQNIRFHYAGRSADIMAYRTALAETLGEAFTLHCDDDASALNLDALIATLGDAHLYVCGPRGMIDAARAKAEAAGVPADRIHFELFEAAAPQEGDTAFEVQINDGSVFTIPPGRSIIDVLEENDVDVMYDCQRGDCGICQCDVLEGEPDHRDVVLSEAERAAGDVMQICVSRAKSARLVLDI